MVYAFFNDQTERKSTMNAYRNGSLLAAALNIDRMRACCPRNDIHATTKREQEVFRCPISEIP